MESRLNRRLEIGFCLMLLAVLGLLFVVSLGYPSKPRQLPMIVDTIGILIVLVHLVNVIRTPAIAGAKTGAGVNWRAVMIAFGSIFGYLILTYFIGMVSPMVLLVYGTGMAFGGRSKPTTLAMAVLTPVAIYLVFEIFLGVRLYPGILFP
jgi:hypothetical protein